MGLPPAPLLAEEAQPQGVVVRGETVEGRRQGRPGEPAPGDEQHRLVVELRPPPPLGEEVALDRRQRRVPGHRPLVLVGVLHGAPGRRGQAGDRLVLEELPGGDREPRPAGPRHHLDAEDRVAAELEEVVVHPHPLEAEHLAPDRGQPLLPRVAGRGRAGQPGGRRRRGERPAVDLALGGERQRGERHEGRRHHVLRQPAAQEGPQLYVRRRRRFVAAGGHEIGHQAPFPRHHLRLADPRVA